MHTIIIIPIFALGIINKVYVIMKKCFICLIAFVLLLIVGCDSGDIAMCIDNDNCEDSCFVDSTSYNQLEDQIDSLKGEKLKPKGNGTDNKPRRKR